MSETPLPNSPDARTPTGEIKDPASITTTPTETPKTTEPKTEPSTAADPGKDAAGNTKSLLDGDKDAKGNEYHGAPEKYEPYKLGEGDKVDEKTVSEANDMFRKMGLSQKAGQELVEFYNKHVKTQIDDQAQAYQDLRKSWREQTMNDPDIGGRNLDQTKANISRVLDAYPDQKVVGDFKEKMNLTGAGDLASFVKVFNWMAVRLSEGGFIRGNNPAGQTRDGGIRPSLAKAMFPGLPSASDVN